MHGPKTLGDNDLDWRGTVIYTERHRMFALGGTVMFIFNLKEAPHG
jgi:hypothetical protein